MLFINVLINDKEIDSISIHNVTMYEDLHTNNHQYKIIFPHGYDDKLIHHYRDEGYRPLLVKCLKYMEEVDALQRDTAEF